MKTCPHKVLCLNIHSALSVVPPKLKMWKWKLLNRVWLFGILQARTLEWVAFPFSRESSQPRNWTQVSCIAGKFSTSWATREAQECWSGKPIPSPADLSDPGIKPGSPALQVDSLPNELWGKPKKLEIWLPKNDWTSKLWNIHIFKDYLAMKRNKLLTCSVTWKNLTVTMMSERRPMK